MAKIHIGTSGWSYGHWVGPFYPRGTRTRDFLPHYARTFSAVEINATFYRLPAPETLTTWRDETPPGFVFACKASRYLTHMKKLKDPEKGLEPFFDAIEHLRPKLGPVLFQLPPRWRVNPERLEGFLAALPAGHRTAFEFRDESWFAAEIDNALKAHNAAFCIYDLAGRLSPITVTADFVYVRLHGPDGPYRGSYDDRTLSTWADRLRGWQTDGRDVYCFFDDDEKGYAVRNALRLQEMLAGA